jgi:hypothetical protein
MNRGTPRLTMHLSRPGPPALSLEALAHLSAYLDPGLGERAEILATVGLDEASWQRLRAAWLAKLAAGASPGLAQRFSFAYAQARLQPGPPPPGDAEDTLPDGSPPAAMGPGGECVAELDVDVDGTAELAFPLAGPALPFKLPPALAPDAPLACQPLTAPDPAEMTLEVPCIVPPMPHAVVPFVPPMNGRPQRLVRYDTATGKPLAQPYWIDDPTPAAR